LSQFEAFPRCLFGAVRLVRHIAHVETFGHSNAAHVAVVGAVCLGNHAAHPSRFDAQRAPPRATAWAPR